MKLDNKILNHKIELIQWLTSLEDKVIIEKLLKFRKAETKDWWENVKEGKKKSILQGIKDADNNKLNPHSFAIKLYEKWL